MITTNTVNGGQKDLKSKLLGITTEIDTLRTQVQRIELDLSKASQYRNVYASHACFTKFGAQQAISGLNSTTELSEDEIIALAKAELVQFNQQLELDAQSKAKAKAQLQSNLSQQIENTRQMFQKNANLVAAGIKYVHHFVSIFGGVIKHIEMVSTSMVFCITSTGYIEVWQLESAGQWTLVEFWNLSQPTTPNNAEWTNITTIVSLTPTPQELAHLLANKTHYMKQEVADKGYLAPKSPRKPTSNATTADTLVMEFTSSTYDLGGGVSVSDEQAIRRLNYYNFLISHFESTNHAVGNSSVYKFMYLIGSAQGHLSVLEITINVSKDPVLEFKVFPNQHKVPFSNLPITIATYFAPGHHAVIVAYPKDQSGPELVGLTVPHLSLAFKVPICSLIDQLATDDPVPVPYTIQALASDNINLKLNLSVSNILVQIEFSTLPLIIDETYNNNLDELGNSIKHPVEELELTPIATYKLPIESSDVISSICSFTSNYTFYEYLVIGTNTGSMHCVRASDLVFADLGSVNDLVFYRNDNLPAETVVPSIVSTYTSGNTCAHLAMIVNELGWIGIISMDRRELVHESRRVLTDNSLTSKMNHCCDQKPFQIWVGNVEVGLVAVSFHNEWSILKLNDLSSWLESNPLDSSQKLNDLLI